jgi:hypothetical protein
MKIRIRGNFVRYRLTQSEVLQLKNDGLVKEETCFGPGAGQVLTYVLEADPIVQYLSASFSDNTIRMALPSQEANIWYDSNQVGYEHDIEVMPGQVLKLLLEKDFACLDDTDEDQSDNYPNPLLQK